MFNQQNRTDQKTVDENTYKICIPCSKSLGNKKMKAYFYYFLKAI